MRYMQPSSVELLRELHIAVDDRRFRHDAHAAKPEPERSWAFVHGAVLGHARIFGMLHDGKIDFRRRTQRIAHGGFAEDRLAIVGDSDGSRSLQGAKVGQHRAFAGLGSGGDWEHVGHSSTLRLAYPRDPLGRVEHRRGVGHAAHGSEAASCGCRRSGCYRFLVALPGLAQMSMQVNESGRDDQTLRLNFFVSSAANFVRRCNLRDLPVAQKKVHDRVHTCEGIDDASSANQQRSRPVIFRHTYLALPRARASTAMRSGTPFFTSSTITDCGQSATSQVSSSPRIIGPGCISRASDFANRSRAMVIWYLEM